MNKYLLTGLLAISVLAQTALALPNTETKVNPIQPQRVENGVPKPPKKPAPPENEFKSRLNLTQEQLDKAKALRIASQEKMKPLMEELRQKQAERNRLENFDSDDTKIQQLNNEIRTLRKQIHEIIMQNERDFIQILTPEQQSEFNKMREERKKMFEKRREMKRKQQTNH